MIFTALALICSIAVPVSDCTRDTAVAVISLPSCGLGGQGVVADTAIRPDEGHYLKTICEGR